MLSSQRLWPSSCRRSVGFMLRPPSGGWVRGGPLGDFASHLGDVVDGEAELGLDVRERRRLSKSTHTHDRALRTGIALPAESRALLDRHAGGDPRRQHLVAVGLVLLLEDLPAGKADHTGADLALQLLVSTEGELDLAAGGDQDQLRLAVLGIGEHVTAA